MNKSVKFEQLMQSRGVTDFSTCQDQYYNPDVQMAWEMFLEGHNQKHGSYYDEGWNDYVAGIIPDFCEPHPYTQDYKDGWFDCLEATEAYGQQMTI